MCYLFQGNSNADSDYSSGEYSTMVEKELGNVYK
jgi:hypothetical protein